MDEHLDWVVIERRIYFYVLRLVSGYLALDIGGTSVTLSLIPVVMAAVDAGIPTAWGSLMLVELYRDLHQIIYQGARHQARSMGFTTLLLVWA